MRLFLLSLLFIFPVYGHDCPPKEQPIIIKQSLGKPPPVRTKNKIVLKNPKRIYSWDTIKLKLRKKVLSLNNPVTLYAGCTITPMYHVNLKSCNFYYARSFSKYKKKGFGNIDAEHAVTSKRMMRHAKCTTSSRVKCRKTNKQFKRCHNDIHNVYPSISVINRYRGNMEFTEIPDNLVSYPFGKEIGFKRYIGQRLVEPPLRAKKSIGYSYLYMAKIGCIDLTINEYNMYKRWYSLPSIQLR